MPRAPAPVYLDEDVSVIVAAILKARGFDVVTARDAGQPGRSDFQQLAFGAEAGRVLLTHNRVDFERLHREWFGWRPVDPMRASSLPGGVHPGIWLQGWDDCSLDWPLKT